MFPDKDKHYLSTVMERISEMVGAEVITENENDNAGAHRILKHIVKGCPSVSIPVSSVDPALLPPQTDAEVKRRADLQRAVASMDTLRSLESDQAAYDEALRAQLAELEAKCTAELEVLRRQGDVYIKTEDLDRTIPLEPSPFLGDELTDRRFSMRQRNSPDFKYGALLLGFGDWHAFRVIFLNYWCHVYNEDLLGTPGSMVWMTNQIKLLRKIQTKEKHFDRLRDHMRAMGDSHTIGVAMGFLRMTTQDSAPALDLPSHLSPTNPAHVIGFLYAVSSHIVKKFMRPSGFTRACTFHELEPRTLMPRPIVLRTLW
jgi:hypothetical protein